MPGPPSRCRAAAVAFAVTMLLPACADERLTPLNEGPEAPPGLAPADGADALTVGHRLMRAGEYELALKAFLRAAGERGLDAEVLSALGSANLRLGRLGQAEDLLRRAVAEDERFAAAWNNLGVVLMERGEIGEASRVFRTAFALDSGETAEIRENLRTALARLESPAYTAENDEASYSLVRQGSGSYELLSAR